jgi:WD40 repeat protein
VVPDLRARPRTTVVLCRTWQDPSFLDRLKRELVAEIHTGQANSTTLDPTLPLDDLLDAAARETAGHVVLILYQFEEYLFYQRDSGSGTEFDAQLARAINREEIEASFLLALREDSLAKLDRFRGRLPNVFSNTLRLRHMDRQTATDAIRKPLVVYGDRSHRTVTIEDALVDRLLGEVGTGQVSLGEIVGAGRGEASPEAAAIETPFLQLVLMRLWREEMAAGSAVLRVETLARLGGAKSIARSHLDAVMQALAPDEREVCARFFDRLVTPSGNKVAYSVDDLRQYAGDIADRVPTVLEALSGPRTRVLRQIASSLPGAPTRYEIFHDVLAPAVLAWRARYADARQRADAERRAEEQHRLADQRARTAARLRRLSGALATLVLVSAGAALVAWNQTQRANDAAEKARAAQRTAQEHTRRAVSRDLANKARDQLDDELDLALLLGVESTRAEPTPEAKASLFDALERNPFAVVFRRDAIPMSRSSVVSPDRTIRATVGCAAMTGASCKQGKIVLSNPATGTPLGAPLLDHETDVTDVTFDDDGRMLATADLKGIVIVWDVANRRKLSQTIDKVNDGAISLAFSPDGRTIAVGSGVRNIRLVDTASGRLVGPVLVGPPGQVARVVFRPDGKRLASWNDSGVVLEWDLGATLPGHIDDVWTIAFSPDGTLLASGSCESRVERNCVRGEIRLWNLTGRRPQRPPIVAHSDGVTSLAFAPDGRTLASGGCGQSDHGACKAGDVRLWDVPTGEPLGAPLPAGDSWNVRVAFSPDGKLLATQGPHNTVALWDVASRTMLEPALEGHSEPPQALAFSPDGRILASGGWDDRIILWDVAQRRAIGSSLAGEDAVNSIAFSPDGRTLASSSNNYTVNLWDVASMKPDGAPLPGHTAEVMSVAFSPDGRTLASGSKDATVILWDVASRQPLGAPLTAQANWINFVAFSPDGRTLASASSDHSILVRDVTLLEERDLAAWQARACRIANRNITPEEWTRYMGSASYHATCESVPATGTER